MIRFNLPQKKFRKRMLLWLTFILFIPSALLAQDFDAGVEKDANCDDVGGEVYIEGVNTEVHKVIWTDASEQQISTETTVTDLASGVYFVQVILGACDAVAFESTVQVKKSPGYDVSISASGEIKEACDNSSGGTCKLSASVEGGESGVAYTYRWSTGATSKSITVKEAGSYAVSVSTSTAKCAATDEILIVSKNVECSKDPNDIKGPEGYGEAHYIASKTTMGYTIRFENDPVFATAPAKRVKVTLPLDDNMKLSSFRLGDFGFGSFDFSVDDDARSLTEKYNVVDSLGVYVRVTAGINIVNREAFWLFESLDPQTGLDPDDAMLGFLSVNDSLGRGEGYITFTIEPSDDANTGDSIFAEADIVFDDNEIIATNLWVNVLDALSPTSSLDSTNLSAVDSTGDIAVSFSAMDDIGGSGVKNVTLFMAENDDAYNAVGRFNIDSTAYLSAVSGNVYSLFCVAEDNAGNRERMKSISDISFNLSQSPTAMYISEFTFDEFSPLGTAVGDLSTRGNSFSDKYTYELVAGEGDDDNTLFDIEASSLLTSFDFACLPHTEYSVRVKTTNLGGMSLEQSFLLYLNNVYNENDTTYDVVELCENDSLIIGDTLINSAGNHLITLTSSKGCDSMVYLTVYPLPVHYDVIDTAICFGDTIEFGEYGSLATSGSYYKHLTNEYGCDSTVELNLTVHPTYHRLDTLVICDSELPYDYFGLTIPDGTISGDTLFNLVSEYGCDSLVTLSIVVNKTYEGQDTLTICDSELPYQYYGKTIPVGTFSKDTVMRFNTVNACDSLVILSLTIYPTFDVKDTLVICDSELPYDFYGKIIPDNPMIGDTLLVFETVYGCDSLVQLTVIVNSSYEVSDTLVICDSELPYNFYGKILPLGTMSGDTLLHFETITACDSSVNLNVTVFPTYNVMDELVICDTELPYDYYGKMIPVGTYSGDTVLNFTTVNSCDSLVTLSLTINPTYNVVDELVLCDNELPYDYYGKTLPVGILSQDTVLAFETLAGCDSSVTLTLTINPTFNVYDTLVICDSELPYDFNGKILPVGTVSSDTLLYFETIYACDSLVNLSVTIFPTYNVMDELVICDTELPYDYYGKIIPVGTYSGDTVLNFTTVNSCDSLVTLLMTINPTRLDSVSASICEGDVYTLGNQQLTVSGMYSEVFSTSRACDSTVVLNLTVFPIYNDTIYEEVCFNEGDIFTFGDQSLDQSGLYTEVFASKSGCDSTVVLYLTVKRAYFAQYDTAICVGESYEFFDQTYTMAGTYSKSFTTVEGCDSLFELNLEVNPIYFDTLYVEICQGDIYDLGAQQLSITGIYSEVFISQSGCDSTVTVSLIVNEVYNIDDSDTVCLSDDESYTFGSQSLNESGVYTEVFASQRGCDSTVILDLTINRSKNDTIEMVICEGESYNGWTVSDTYVERLQTSSGCDSIVTTLLTVESLTKPTITQHANVLFCDDIANSYMWYFNGEFISGKIENSCVADSAGYYQVALVSSNGCESALSDSLNVMLSGLEDNSITRSVKIYPNPTKDFIRIEGLKPSVETHLEIYDNSGKRLYAKSVISFKVEFDMSAYPDGNYYLIVNQGDISASYMIIKE